MTLMKRIAIAILLLVAGAVGQAARYDSTGQTVVSLTGVSLLAPAPGSSITVCNYPATGGIASGAAGPCTNTAAVCPDSTLTGCTTGSPNNPVFADAQGNFGYWVAPGVYQYTICPSGGTCKGPFNAWIPIGAYSNGAVNFPSSPISWAGLQTYNGGAATQNFVSGGVAAWGDSFTSGNEGNANQGSWPLQLQSYLGPNVVNQGLGGQTSTQICVRYGACPTSFATLSPNIIPACTSTPCTTSTVTFPSGHQPIVVQGSPAVSYNFVTGTVQSSPTIHGTVTYDGATYTFTPDVNTSGATVANGTNFVLDKPYISYIPIFWEGRNDILITGCSTILANLAAQVALVPSGVPYLILSMPNKDVSTEWIGQADYTTITSCNASIAAAYPNNYIDIRSTLIAAYNPLNTIDIANHAEDVPPTSLRAFQDSGTLNGGIGIATCSSTPINVNVAVGGALVGLGYIVSIENELISITTVSGGNQATACVRGYDGTAISAHADGTAYVQTDPNHFNATGYGVVASAVAAKLKSMSVLIPNQVGVLSSAAGTSFRAFDYQNTALGNGAMRYVTGSGNTGVGSLVMDNATTAVQNIGVGANALGSLTSGTRNVVMGFNAGQKITTASSNVIVGTFGFSNGTSSNNTCVGSLCLNLATSGGNNSGFGFEVLKTLTTGSSNTAGGFRSLTLLSTGGSNTAFGYGTGQSMTTHNFTTAVGALAAANNDVDNTTAFGAGALGLLTSGTSNTAVGHGALGDVVTGSSNTAIGEQALATATASNNSAVGTNSLVALLGGVDNTAVGTTSCPSLTTGNDNTCVGYQSGYNAGTPLQSNSQSTFIGVGANASVNGLTNDSAIGYQAQTTASNQIVLGNGLVTSVVMNGVPTINGLTGASTRCANISSTGVLGVSTNDCNSGASTAVITDDTTTAATMYPVWVTASTGSLPLKVASTKFTFNPSTGVHGSTIFNATTGYQIGGAAASGKILVGNGTNYVASTPTFPNASATSGKYIRSDGTNWIASTGSASGVGSPTACTNQAVTAFTLASDAAPTSTCSTITSSFVDSTIAPTASPTFTGTVNNNGTYTSNSMPIFVFVTTDFTAAANTALQAITGLTVTMPASKALNVPFECDLMYSQATAAVPMQFGIKSVTTAPTQINAMAWVSTSATAATYGNLQGLATTTATPIVTFTPSAITTIWNARLSGVIEQPSGSASAIQIMGQTSNSGDLFTIKRGSWCRFGPI